MHPEVPLHRPEASEEVPWQASLSKRNTCHGVGWGWAEWPEAAGTTLVRCVINRLSSGKLSPVKIKWNSRYQIRAYVCSNGREEKTRVVHVNWRRRTPLDYRLNRPAAQNPSDDAGRITRDGNLICQSSRSRMPNVEVGLTAVHIRVASRCKSIG